MRAKPHPGIGSALRPQAIKILGTIQLQIQDDNMAPTSKGVKKDKLEDILTDYNHLPLLLTSKGLAAGGIYSRILLRIK